MYSKNRSAVCCVVARWRDAWGEHFAEGLAIHDESGDRIELTRAGLLQVDSLLPAFFEPQFEGVRYT